MAKKSTPSPDLSAESESNLPAVQGYQPGDRGGSVSLSPAQARQVAFIHDIHSSRCKGKESGCPGCHSCEMAQSMKELAGKHLGYL